MKISHVIRGEEHLSNTPYQLMIVDALAYERPVAYAHMPLILAKTGAKLSKRKHPGKQPDAVSRAGFICLRRSINYLALLGWNPGTPQEIFTFDELVKVFSFDRVQHAGARFDWEKLTGSTASGIRAMEDAELVRRLEPFLPTSTARRSCARCRR